MLRSKLLIVLFLLSSFLFIADKTGFLFPVRNAAEVVILPVQYGVYSLHSNLVDRFRVLTFWRSGENRIKDLERRNLELISDLSILQELKNENLILRRQLDIDEGNSGSKILANVIGSNEYLILDKGSNSGVSYKDVVIIENILVGVVSKVTPQRSYVLTILNNQLKVPVKIGEVRGITSGQFGNAVLLDKVNQNEALNPGDLILTNGDGDVSVPNLLVGKVGKIKSRESDIFKVAEVNILANYSKLKKVFILIQK